MDDYWIGGVKWFLNSSPESEEMEPCRGFEQSQIKPDLSDVFQVY